jgi:hypothetical protein
MKPRKESSPHLHLDPATRGGDDGGSQKNHAEGDDGWPAPAPAQHDPGTRRPPSKTRAFCSVRHRRLPAPPPRRGTTPTPTPMQGAMPMSPLRAVAPVPTRESLHRTRALLKPSVSSDREADRQGSDRGWKPWAFQNQKWRLRGRRDADVHGAGPYVCVWADECAAIKSLHGDHNVWFLLSRYYIFLRKQLK